jgi:hypothetical protein
MTTFQDQDLHASFRKKISTGSADYATADYNNLGVHLVRFLLLFDPFFSLHQNKKKWYCLAWLILTGSMRDRILKCRTISNRHHRMMYLSLLSAAG